MCAISSSSPSLHAAPGSSSRSCSSPPAAASAGTSAASLDFQPPYFPPPTASQLSSLSQLSSQLSQEHQQMFSQLPVSLASLQPLPSLVPAPAPAPAPALSDTFHSVQTGLAGRRLTQDSGSPLSLVRPGLVTSLSITTVTVQAASTSPGPGPGHFSYEGGAARRELLAQRERSSVDSQDSVSAPLSSPHHDQVSRARCEHSK